MFETVTENSSQMGVLQGKSHKERITENQLEKKTVPPPFIDI